MLKYALLAGSMMIAAPAFAQTAAPQNNVPPAPVSTDAAAPVTSDAQAAPAAAQTQPVPATPAPNAQAAAPAPADPATATAQTAPAEPAAGAEATGDQVAVVVGKEFPTYDKNADGALSKTEFSDWMLALKTASDPSTKAEDPKTKTWMTQAFAQADTDKSKSVSKDELTKFLAQATKAS